MGLSNHLKLSIIDLFTKVTTKVADRDVKESYEKTVNLEMLWRWNKNYFNVLMNILANGIN